MASLFQLFLLTLLCVTNAHPNQTPEMYIVYMGSSSSNIDGEEGVNADRAAHLEQLASVIPSEEKERLLLIHSYHHTFKGFSAMLTKKEAAVLSAESGAAQSNGQYPKVSNDVIIGLVDTGIWPESPSFSDAGIGEIPSRWRGTCMEGIDFKKSNCNRKLIGARYYTIGTNPPRPSSSTNATGSPRDSVDHGTHTASTAAGAVVPNASYYGLARGTAKGGSPSSRIAMYKACSLSGCMGSNILKAIDDAVSDGVDIVSISVGISSIFQLDFLNDPIAIGAFHATQKGVLVVCSGGNDGPEPYTVVNSAPWIFTIGASSIDRRFQSNIVLGNGDVLKGSAINFSNLTRAQSTPLAFAGDVASKLTPLSESSNCYPGSLDARKAAGKIIVCLNDDQSVPRRVKKLVTEATGAKGLIIIDAMENGVAFDSGGFPLSEVGSRVGARVLRYINSTRNPTATILPSVTVGRSKPAPIVAYFSSRGPGGLTEGIIKPDIMAPGVGILAATIPTFATGRDPVAGKKPSNFALKSGTSMACPHVSGAAAFVKSARPGWTPSMIKSALMTTASTSNNVGKPITNSSNGGATPLDMGAGEINPIRALDPGLVFETTTMDHLLFLCYYGYKDQLISSISGVNFSCPNNSSDALISDINYPSISIANLDGRQSARTISRTVTNVGPESAAYVASVNVMNGLMVKVSPERLVFSRGSKMATFQVSFDGKGAKKGYGFGSVTWSDGVRYVRLAFAVNVI
ncbi:Subtilisin-like protease [Acorus gramineus]|uniref:Subtilisin-like protease n=1 Tax=Acorus gramineus TaxID=55184 RepID=A0AAV9BXM4_ACOGR|nr:Subtilisin-like protease [Acorus gramineus]